MGTKVKPGKFDCYNKALPTEPVFVLLGRDPNFYQSVNDWADRREMDIMCGERPLSDLDMVNEARRCAAEGAEWRRLHMGEWRSGQPLDNQSIIDVLDTLAAGATGELQIRLQNVRTWLNDDIKTR